MILAHICLFQGKKPPSGLLLEIVTFCTHLSALIESTKEWLFVSGRHPVGSGCTPRAFPGTIQTGDGDRFLPHLCPAPFWSHCRILRFSGKKTLPDFQVSDFCFMAILNQLSPNQSWKNHLVQTVKHSQRAGAVTPGRWSSARLALCSLFLGNYKAQKSLRTWLGPGVR